MARGTDRPGGGGVPAQRSEPRRAPAATSTARPSAPTRPAPGTRLTTCPEHVADCERISYLCADGKHDRCTGLIMQTRERAPRSVLRLCDCPEPACTCQNRGRRTAADRQETGEVIQ